MPNPRTFLLKEKKKRRKKRESGRGKMGRRDGRNFRRQSLRSFWYLHTYNNFRLRQIAFWIVEFIGNVISKTVL